MPKANLILPNGTAITVNGSAEEIAKIMTLYSGTEISVKSNAIETGSKHGTKNIRITEKKGPRPLIRELKDEGFFKQKRTMLEVQRKLEEKGHIYSTPSIAEPLLSLVRKKEIGRVRGKGEEKGGGKKKTYWYYVDR